MRVGRNNLPHIMKLSINTSNRDKVVLTLGDITVTKDSLAGSSQTLLPAIKELMAKQNIEFKEISEIVVFANGGSYTGLRVGVSIAQTLAFLLNVPINGKNIADIGHVDITY